MDFEEKATTDNYNPLDLSFTTFANHVLEDSTDGKNCNSHFSSQILSLLTSCYLTDLTGYLHLRVSLMYCPSSAFLTLQDLTVPETINWNTPFQALMKCENDLYKYRKLAKLARDFVYVADVYGKYVKWLSTTYF